MNKFECMLGNHKCIIPREDDPYTCMCPCGKKGHWKYFNAHEEYYDYDDNGILIHWKRSDGYERWRNNNKWVYKKPKNWKYEC